MTDPTMNAMPPRKNSSAKISAAARTLSARPVSALLNLYAAVPSMHVGFALMVGWSLARLVKPRPLKAVWFLYPFLVTVTVVVTGNHWWIDAVLGALVAGVSALAASGALARARPDAWAFRTGLREAPA